MLAPRSNHAWPGSGEWSAATVIQAGPRLLRAGQIVEGVAENFADSGALAESKHVGIGITDAGKLLFVYVKGMSSMGREPSP